MSLSDEQRKLLQAAFRMPSVQNMLGRRSSITNAYVASIIPVVRPSVEEIAQALQILEMSPENVRCAYCNDRSTEWDHLRPLVLDRRPTGYISEIANLVPACGKCNQSKGNKPWRDWMLSSATRSPTGRGLPDVSDRIKRLERYERWREPVCVDFEAIVGQTEWREYWSLWEAILKDLKASQQVADDIKQRVLDHLLPDRTDEMS